jgi:hypothetical protein
VSDTNGKESIVARSRAHYEIRAGKNVRGKPAARVLMDEMREQKDWSVWNAVSQTSKSFWNGMLIGFSNAGDVSGAIVLRTQRDAALADEASGPLRRVRRHVGRGVRERPRHVARALRVVGAGRVREGRRRRDPAGEPVDRVRPMTVASALADIRGMTDAGYRTEVLCQWVTSKVDSFIDVKDWKGLHVPISECRSRWGRARCGASTLPRTGRGRGSPPR